MRSLGIVGGVTWHSTAVYYQQLNAGVVRALGPGRSADLHVRSFDYGAVEAARADGDWRPLGRLVVKAARDLRRVGAEGILLGSNSLHALAPRVEAEVGLPLVHIADATASAALERGLHSVALFGTGFTMTRPHIRRRLEAHGLQVHVPDAVEAIDRIVMHELTRGVFRDESRAFLLDALEPLIAQGAQAMVLGCTEIPLLIQQEHTPVPVLDTLALHVEAALAWMLFSPDGSRGSNG